MPADWSGAWYRRKRSGTWRNPNTGRVVQAPPDSSRDSLYGRKTLVVERKNVNVYGRDSPTIVNKLKFVKRKSEA